MTNRTENVRSPATTDESVFLLHGLGAHWMVMWPLERSLRAHGYRVRNWGYHSLRGTIARHAERLRADLQQMDQDPSVTKIHLVTHSMGGIVARMAIHESRPEKLGRCVMLGPPNRGSHVARFLAGPLGRWCRPLGELSDAPGSLVNQLDEPQDLELGVIAAAADLVVRRHSTHLHCQSEHITLPGYHGQLPLRSQTARQVVHFLRYGAFER